MGISTAVIVGAGPGFAAAPAQWSGQGHDMVPLARDTGRPAPLTAETF